MKKKNLNSLALNKKTISPLDIKAGKMNSWGSMYCTMPTMQCASMTGGSCKETQYACE